MTAPAALTTQAHPTRLGKYQITRVLGEGAMGRVYQALDPLLQRHVAVKAIRPQLLQDDSNDLSRLSLNERFRIEAQAAGRLSHPGIVAVYEYGEEDGTAYIAMEYVKGHPLTHYLGGPKPLAEDDALSVAVQVLEALHHAHELGVWHRDIKPGNLIVTADGCVKVTDFGIARLESTLGLSRQKTLLLVGSPGYIAPERYTGEPPDRRVDIFSCGVLLYQLLTGVPPFTGSASEVMYQVLHGEPIPPSRASGARTASIGNYDAVVSKALARRPADRYATALELRDALLSVARRPVSRRLKASAMARVPAIDPGPPTPVFSTTVSNVVEMPTLRIARRGPLPIPMPQRTATLDAVSKPVWPAGSLHAIELALTEPMGPIAAVMIQRATPHCHDLPALLRCLISQGLTAREQRAFLADVRKRLVGVADLSAGGERSRAASAPWPSQPASAQVPVLQDAATIVALRPQTVERTKALLLAKIGPIATVLVQRALTVSTDRTGFFVALADQLRGCLDRHALLRVLQRLD